MINEFNLTTILFSGVAKVPQNAPYYSQKQEVSCIIEVDMENGKIVNCEFGKLKALTNDFLKRLVVGYTIQEGMEPLYQEIHKRCNMIMKNSIIKTLDICYHKYLEYETKQQKNNR